MDKIDPSQNYFFHVQKYLRNYKAFFLLDDRIPSVTSQMSMKYLWQLLAGDTRLVGFAGVQSCSLNCMNKLVNMRQSLDHSTHFCLFAQHSMDENSLIN